MVVLTLSLAFALIMVTGEHVHYRRKNQKNIKKLEQLETCLGLLSNEENVIEGATLPQVNDSRWHHSVNSYSKYEDFTLGPVKLTFLRKWDENTKKFVYDICDIKVGETSVAAGDPALPYIEAVRTSYVNRELQKLEERQQLKAVSR